MSIAEHVLLASDFSEASEEAVGKAADLARTAGARLTVLTVHGYPPQAAESVIPSPIPTHLSLAKGAREALHKLCDAALADVEQKEIVALEHASPAIAICEYAEKHGVDLIVLGTHGRTGIRHLLIGSVAERVVRLAPCPILVVPHAKYR